MNGASYIIQSITEIFVVFSTCRKPWTEKTKGIPKTGRTEILMQEGLKNLKAQEEKVKYCLAQLVSFEWGR